MELWFKCSGYPVSLMFLNRSVYLISYNIMKLLVQSIFLIHDSFSGSLISFERFIFGLGVKKMKLMWFLRKHPKYDLLLMILVPICQERSMASASGGLLFMPIKTMFI